jgi:3-oxocholest-4-en-26-oate---CoA ligase
MALNMADLFEHAADAFPDRTAVIVGDRQLTYRELEAEANRLAHYLASQGVGKDAHVGLYARNSVEAVVTIMATFKLRAAIININYRYLHNELAYLLDDADLDALVYDHELEPIVTATVRETLPRVEIGGSYQELIAVEEPDRDFGERSADDLFFIYTGGTTGQPKGVMWRHEDIWRTLAGGIDFITGVPLPDEWAQSAKGAESGGMVRIAAAPLIHGNAMVATLASLFSGDTVVLLRKFDPHQVWDAVEKHKVNVLVIIGDAMARPLIDALGEKDYDTSSLWSFSSSASLFSKTVREAAAAALPNVMITDAIGSSETGFAGIAFISAGDEHKGGPTVTAGPDVIVIDDDGNICQTGQIGRLGRGGHIPLGYWKDPEKTAALFVEVNGKRYTVPGDWARVEDDGTITMLGRGNTCVNTGGEKVFPEEVENALKSHPDVFDAIVVGVPDDRLGQRVGALLQIAPGVTVDLAAVDAHVRAQLAGYKVPRSVWLVDEIGRTVSGKADYRWANDYVSTHEAAS